MPSKLPAVQMPAKEDPQPRTKHCSTAPKLDTIDNLLEQLGDKDMPQDNDSEEEIVTIDPRRKFEEKEVFNQETQKTAISESSESSESTEKLTQEEPQMNSEIGEVPEKKGRRKYQRKGEMSEKQKAHLERIRAKALENKKKRKEEMESLEKEKAKALEEKREKKRLEDEEKQRQKEVERQAKEAERLATAMSANMYSKEDLENAMITAIHTYDTHRKEQKAIKRKKQAEEAQRARQTRLIQQAINPEPQVDPWRRYFS